MVAAAAGAALCVAAPAADRAGGVADAGHQLRQQPDQPPDVRVRAQQRPAAPGDPAGLHGCQGSGPYFYSSTQFASLADQYGFVVIYPSVTRSYDCWDVSDPSSLTHNGNNDPAGLMSMVQYVEQHNNGDASRVYVTG